MLHDEAVQEAAILAADPLLDLGLRAVAWLEGIAADALRTKGYAALDAHPRNTAFLINQGVGDAPSSLDPDAPFREGKSLDGRDLEAQAAMLRALWHYVRAGQIREAQEYCRASRQWWRAASIGGGTAWQWDGAKGKWVGNPRRSLWRGACAAIAKRAAARKGEAGYDDEAAVYAVLSDCVEVRLATPPPTHRPPRRPSQLPTPLTPLPSSLQLLDTHVTPRCASWEDALWARLRLPLRARLATLQSSLSAAADDWPRPAPGVGADDLAPQLDVRRAQLQSALAAQRLPFAELKRLIAAAAADPADPAAADGTAAAAAAAAAGATGSSKGRSSASAPPRRRGRPPAARGAPTAPPAAVPDAAETYLSALRALLPSHADLYEPPAAPGAAAAPAAAGGASRRILAHRLRFGAHLGLFLSWLPHAGSTGGLGGGGARARAAGGGATVIALHDDASAEGSGWQQVLRAYVEVFGEAAAATAQAAADAAHSPTAEAAALPGVPARLALPEMAAQLARLSTALHPVEAIVDAFASFLQRLPPTLPRDLFDSCVRAAADVDPVYTLLLPKIALKRRCLAQRAAPLPPPAARAAVSATAAAVAAEANARLQTAAWLQGRPTRAVASLLAEKYWLHQSLAQAAWLLRRLLGRADFDATTLLLRAVARRRRRRRRRRRGARGGSLVTATFDLLGQNDHGLAYLLLRTGDGAGALGAAAAMPAELDGQLGRVRGALPHGGAPMQIDGGDDASGLPLWRAELSLVVRHGELAFHKAEVKHEQRLAHSDAHKAYLRQRREWAAALVEGGGASRRAKGPALVDAPPRATAPLMVAAIHARHEALVIDEAAAEAGGALPPTAASRARVRRDAAPRQ